MLTVYPLEYRYKKMRGYTKMEMTRNDQERLLNRIKEGENALLEHTKQLREKLEAKSATIDDIEMIMLKTMQTLRHCTIAITEDILSEEGLKKTRRKSMKNVEGE